MATLCTSYFSNGACSSCAWSSDGTTLKCLQTLNATYQITSDTPYSCSDTSSSHDGIANCVTCTQTGGVDTTVTCTQCAVGWYLTAAGGCTACSTIHVNCTSCTLSSNTPFCLTLSSTWDYVQTHGSVAPCLSAVDSDNTAYDSNSCCQNCIFNLSASPKYQCVTVTHSNF